MSVTRKAILAVGRSLTKTLAIMAGVIVASFLLMAISPQLGAAAMLAYSSFMVVKSSQQDTPLTRFTALLPGGMALVCYGLQLSFIDAGGSSLPLLGFAAGIGLGWLLCRGHEIYEKAGRLFAHKTSLYVIVWVATYAFTQASALAGLRDIAGFGLMLSGLSSAMVATLSVLLLMKLKGRQGPPASPGGVTAGFVLLGALLPALAMLPHDRASSYSGHVPVGRHPAGAIDETNRAGEAARGDVLRVAYSESGWAGRWSIRLRSTGPDRSPGSADWVIVDEPDGTYVTALGARVRAQVEGNSLRVSYSPTNGVNVTASLTRHGESCSGTSIMNLQNMRMRFTVTSCQRVYKPPSQSTDELLPPVDVTPRDYEALPDDEAWPDYESTSVDYDRDSLSDDAVIVAVLVAFIQMLASLGLLGAQAMAQGAAGAAPAGSEDRRRTRSSLVNPYDGAPFETDGQGNYWAPDANGDWRWMGESDAREAAAALQAEVNKRDQERSAFERETERFYEQRQRDLEAAAVEAEQESANEQARQERIDDLLHRGQGLIHMVDDPVRAQQLDDFLERHRNDPAALAQAVAAIRSQTFEAEQQRSIGESEAARADSLFYEGAEQVASFIENASKAGIAATGGAMVAGGGFAVTSAMAWAAGATGAVGGFEAGSESYHRGDSFVEGVQNVAGAATISAAQGALYVGTNLPSAGTGVKMAGAFGQSMLNAVDHLRRGGSAEQAAIRGSISFVSGAIGQGIEAGLGRGVSGTVADATLAATEGGLQSVASGESFEEGARGGLAGWAAGRTGGGVAGEAAEHTSDVVSRTPSGQQAEEGGAAPPTPGDTEEGAAAPPSGAETEEGAAAPPRPAEAEDGAAAPPPGAEAEEGATPTPSGAEAEEAATPTSAEAAPEEAATPAPAEAEAEEAATPTSAEAEPEEAATSTRAGTEAEEAPSSQAETEEAVAATSSGADVEEGAMAQQPTTDTDEEGLAQQFASEAAAEPQHVPGYDPNDPEIQGLETRLQQLSEGRDRLPDADLRAEVDERIAGIEQQIEARADDLHQQELRAGMAPANQINQERSQGCYEAAAAAGTRTGRSLSDMREAAQTWLAGYTDNPDAPIKGNQIKGFLEHAGLNPRRPIAAMNEAERPYIEIMEQMNQARAADNDAQYAELAQQLNSLPNRPGEIHAAVSAHPDQLHQSLEGSNMVIGLKDSPHMVSLQGSYTDAKGTLWIREVNPDSNVGVDFVRFDEACERYDWDTAYQID
ncbi:MAG: hypothetical protein QNJ62_09440 [Methyloceanibacter sp.]|nr:hypothetical protein [Methyloceanibacter sp.]